MVSPTRLHFCYKKIRLLLINYFGECSTHSDLSSSVLFVRAVVTLPIELFSFKKCKSFQFIIIPDFDIGNLFYAPFSTMNKFDVL